MSLHGFEPWTPASLRIYPRETNPYELDSYKSSALDQTELQARVYNAKLIWVT